MRVRVCDVVDAAVQADGSTEVVRINFETSSRYREYGDYSPRFRFCIDWISPESMMEDIDQVVEPHGHVHEIFPHHAQHCRICLSYLQPPAL